MQPQLMSMGLTLGVHRMTRVLIVFQFLVTNVLTDFFGEIMVGHSKEKFQFSEL